MVQSLSRQRSELQRHLQWSEPGRPRYRPAVFGLAQESVAHHSGILGSGRNVLQSYVSEVVPLRIAKTLSVDVVRGDRNEGRRGSLFRPRGVASKNRAELKKGEATGSDLREKESGRFFASHPWRCHGARIQCPL